MNNQKLAEEMQTIYSNDPDMSVKDVILIALEKAEDEHACKVAEDIIQARNEAIEEVWERVIEPYQDEISESMYKHMREGIVSLKSAEKLVKVQPSGMDRTIQDSVDTHCNDLESLPQTSSLPKDTKYDESKAVMAAEKTLPCGCTAETYCDKHKHPSLWKTEKTCPKSKDGKHEFHTRDWIECGDSYSDITCAFCNDTFTISDIESQAKQEGIRISEQKGHSKDYHDMITKQAVSDFARQVEEIDKAIKEEFGHEAYVENKGMVNLDKIRIFIQERLEALKKQAGVGE